MEADHWKKIKDAYSAALDLDRPELAEYLSRLDEDTRAEVERLIAADADAGSFIENPYLVERGAILADDIESTGIDGYKLISQLGSGGMGTVYLAERMGDGFSQRVALKLIKGGTDSNVVLRRFLVERQILASLEHPNIARMLDGGSTSTGVPYFVMEYVDGSPIRAYCDDRFLDTRSRVALFAKVCDAASYAHQKLVVHRDLKPSNILVDQSGEPKLLDFGIAKLLAPDWQSSEETVTATQFRILTPEYSSPEQLRGEATTTLTDVYSLGVVLYELLTGVRPFQTESRDPVALAEAIRTKEPPKPSVAALFDGTRSSADAKATAPGSAHETGDMHRMHSTRRSVPDPTALRGDIDNIVLKAIRSDPERRYASVQEMIEDLQRYLDGLPVKATGDTLRYRAGKFAKRHRTALTAAAGMALLLIGTASVAAWQAIRADRERAVAEARLADARSLANSLIFDVHDSIRELPGSTPARKAIVARALEYLDKLAAEGGNDMTLQTELAAGYERIGDVQGNPLGPNLGETSAAVESYKKALTIREGLFPMANPDNRYATAMLNSKLFRSAQFSGDFADAESYCARATGILEGLTAADPSNAVYRVTAARFNQELADLLVSKTDSNVAEAMDRYNKAITLATSTTPSDANEVADADGISLNEKILSVTQMAYRRLGQRYELEGRKQEALEAFMNSLKECEKLLAAGNPQKPQAEVVLAIALGNAGRLQAVTGAIDAGQQEIDRGIAICEKAAQSDPKNVLARSELALLYWNVGNIGLLRSDAAAALKSFGMAERLQQDLTESNPWDMYNLANLADTYSSMGSAYEHQKDRTHAAAFFKKSYEIWKGMKEKDMLPGYYANKPAETLALMTRAADHQ